MNRKWLVTGLALLIAVPAFAQDQGRLRDERQREMERLENAVRVYTMAQGRGRIGVVVNTEADRDRDRIGARLEGITPGGPADKAGLRVGDIITKFNGTALGGVKADDEDESGPGNKLVELARELEPGDTVRLEYRRGNDSKTATLVAADLGWAGITLRGDGNGFLLRPRVEVGPVVPDINPDFNFNMIFPGLSSAWNGLELIALDPDLGEYFGVKEGLLVVKARGDSTLPLKAGDVIVSFDGRKPTSPSHAMRILRSYEPGETVKLEIMRKQRPMTITWTVPESEMRWRSPRPGRAPRPERGEET